MKQVTRPTSQPLEPAQDGRALGLDFLLERSAAAAPDGAGDEGGWGVFDRFGRWPPAIEAYAVLAIVLAIGVLGLVSFGLHGGFVYREYRWARAPGGRIQSGERAGRAVADRVLASAVLRRRADRVEVAGISRELAVVSVLAPPLSSEPSLPLAAPAVVVVAFPFGDAGGEGRARALAERLSKAGLTASVIGVRKLRSGPARVSYFFDQDGPAASTVASLAGIGGEPARSRSVALRHVHVPGEILVSLP